MAQWPRRFHTDANVGCACLRRLARNAFGASYGCLGSGVVESLGDALWVGAQGGAAVDLVPVAVGRDGHGTFYPSFALTTTSRDPAFWVEAEQDEHSGSGDERDEPTNAFVAVDRAVEVFTALGWPADTARTGVDYICNRLMRAGSRPAAFEALRRDPHAQALLDLDQRGWLAMLRAVLGNQHRDRVHTCAGRGLLLLLLIGHPVEDALAMPDLSDSITRGARSLVAGAAHA